MTPQQRLDAWNWPLREYSQFITVGKQDWHIQRSGRGPRLLLLHGTGASTHSWAGMLPLLADHFEVVAADLPGHGFSAMAHGNGMSLDGMATLTGELLQSIDFAPDLVAGHSAGAAVLARMCLQEHIAPAALVSINGALLALPGLTGLFFNASARLLAAIPIIPSWLSGIGGTDAFARRMVESTGSELDAEGVECYRLLVGHPAHVAAALQMMARWDLESLQRDLPALITPLHIVVCNGDRTVPPSQGAALATIVPSAIVHAIPGLGHLGHEESSAQFAGLLASIAEDSGLSR